MLSQKEIDILNAGYQTFVGRTHVFDVLSEKKWKDTGMENWVQTEYIVALIDRDYDVTTIGKRKRDCDIIVKGKKSGLDVGIEIKTLTHTNYYKEILIKQGIQKHTKADLFLFLVRVDEEALKELSAFLRQDDYSERHRMLNDDWMIMLVKKAEKQ